jgi:hypothetical protein
MGAKFGRDFVRHWRRLQEHAVRKIRESCCPKSVISARSTDKPFYQGANRVRLTNTGQKLYRYWDQVQLISQSVQRKAVLLISIKRKEISKTSLK